MQQYYLLINVSRASLCTALLAYVLKNTVQLIQAVVGDYQLTPTLALLLDIHRRTQSLPELLLQSAHVWIGGLCHWFFR